LETILPHPALLQQSIKTKAMRKFFALLLLLAAGTLRAQDCKNYYYMLNNAEVQMTVYDKNGAVSGIQTWKVSGVTNDGARVRSTIASTFTDNKGKAIAKGQGTYQCDGGKLMADMRMSLPQGENRGVPETEAKLTDSYLEYPGSLAEGMQLPDGSFTMEATTSGMPSTTQFDIRNRRVTGKESIATAAGTWEAYKISYDAVMRVKMAGIGIPMNLKVNEWFVPGFGIVKSETFTKNGKLAGSSVLTGLKK
jgi:hypothetical protein